MFLTATQFNCLTRQSCTANLEGRTPYSPELDLDFGVAVQTTKYKVPSTYLHHSLQLHAPSLEALEATSTSASTSELNLSFLFLPFFFSLLIAQPA